MQMSLYPKDKTSTNYRSLFYFDVRCHVVCQIEQIRHIHIITWVYKNKTSFFCFPLHFVFIWYLCVWCCITHRRLHLNFGQESSNIFNKSVQISIIFHAINFSVWWQRQYQIRWRKKWRNKSVSEVFAASVTL